MSEIKLPQNWKPQLKPVSLVISEIQYECHTWNVPKTCYLGGYIKFTGVYKHGSAGSDDARFIDMRINEFAQLMNLSGLIVDFRELHYVWGDNLNDQPENLYQKPVLYLVPSPKKNAQVYEAYKWALGDKIRTHFLVAFNDLVQEFTVEKRKERYRGITVEVEIDNEGERFASTDEVKRFLALQQSIVTRNIGVFGAFGAMNFSFLVNPEHDMETALEIVKALLKEYGISSETVRINAIGI